MKVEYVRPFLDAARAVLSELGIDKPSVGQIQIVDRPRVQSGLVVMIGIAGRLDGRVFIDMTREAAASIATAVLGQELPDMESMTRSAAAEIANMICGRAVSLLGKSGYAADISPPTVFVGGEISIPDAEGLGKILVAPVVSGIGTLTLNIVVHEVKSHILQTGVPVVAESTSVYAYADLPLAKKLRFFDDPELFLQWHYVAAGQMVWFDPSGKIRPGIAGPGIQSAAAGAWATGDGIIRWFADGPAVTHIQPMPAKSVPATPARYASSILIDGSIENRSIHAAGDIFLLGDAESCALEAGGDIFVLGRFDGGRITDASSVLIHAANSSQISALAAIHLRRGAYFSTLTAPVVSAHAGRILGCTVNASVAVVAAQIGWAESTTRISFDPGLFTKYLDAVVGRIRSFVQKNQKDLGHDALARHRLEKTMAALLKQKSVAILSADQFLQPLEIRRQGQPWKGILPKSGTLNLTGGQIVADPAAYLDAPVPMPAISPPRKTDAKHFVVVTDGQKRRFGELSVDGADVRRFPSFFPAIPRLLWLNAQSLDKAVDEAVRILRLARSSIEARALKEAPAGEPIMVLAGEKRIPRSLKSDWSGDELLAMQKNLDGGFKFENRSKGLYLKVWPAKMGGRPADFDLFRSEISTRRIKPTIAFENIESHFRNATGVPFLIGEPLPPPVDGRFEIRVSPDRLSAKLAVISHRGEGRPVDFAAVLAELSNLSLEHDPDEITTFLQNVKDKDTFRFQGKPPKRGEDATVEMPFIPGMGRCTETGYAGVHVMAQSPHWMRVARGDVLAVIRAPSKGSDGRAVTGSVIAATGGREVHLNAGLGATYERVDGGARILAAQDGHAWLGGDRIHVDGLQTVKELSGPAKISGAVRVEGDISAGADVSITGNVFVAGKIYGKVAVGGSLVCEGGIIGGEVLVEQFAWARFSDKSRITVRRSFTVLHSITSSDLQVGDYLIVSDPGRIYGGEIVAGKGVEASEIGTPIGVVTTLAIGLSPFLRESRLKLDERLRKREQERMELKRELDPLITEYKNAETLQILGKDYEKDMLGDLLRMEAEIAALNEDVGHLADPDRYCFFDGASLAVRDTINPGAAIRFGECPLNEGFGRRGSIYIRKRGDIAIDVDDFRALGITLVPPDISG